MTESSTNKIVVCGFSTDTTEEDIMLYFECKTFCKFGGDVVKVTLDHNGSAIVQFEEPGVAERVASTENYELDGCKLTVKLYQPEDLEKTSNGFNSSDLVSEEESVDYSSEYAGASSSAQDSKDTSELIATGSRYNKPVETNERMSENMASGSNSICNVRSSLNCNVELMSENTSRMVGGSKSSRNVASSYKNIYPSLPRNEEEDMDWSASEQVQRWDRKNGGKQAPCSPSPIREEQAPNYFFNPRYRREIIVESEHKFKLIKLMIDFGKLPEEIKYKQCGIRVNFNKQKCFEICGDNELDADITAIALSEISEGMAEEDVSFVHPWLIKSLESQAGRKWLQDFQRDNRLVFLYQFKSDNLVFSSLNDLFLSEALDTFKKRLLIGKVHTDRKLYFTSRDWYDFKNMLEKNNIVVIDVKENGQRKEVEVRVLGIPSDVIKVTGELEDRFSYCA